MSHVRGPIEKHRLTKDEFLAALANDIDPQKLAGENWTDTEEIPTPKGVKGRWLPNEVGHEGEWYPESFARRRR